MYLYKNIEEREKELIEYLRKNNTATCAEIKRDTSIHIERVYPVSGLKGAYGLAGVKYPYERRMRYGASDKSIRKRSNKIKIL